MPISSKLGEQIEAVCCERDSFEPAENFNKAVCWEHVFFDPAKDFERAGCGDQGSTDLAINIDERAGCGDQGSTNLAINEDGIAECWDQGSTDFADQIPLEQQHNMEQLIQESLYFPEADQLTDDETISRISKRVASIYPIGSQIDHSQTITGITYHSGTEKEDQDIQIKSLLEEHQHPANIPIGGRLTHFVDAGSQQVQTHWQLEESKLFGSTPKPPRSQKET
ncbi:MAG: hypothetical protein EZS28_025393 [Streblomastix strix]|uniref:Uncharacterized protein n=1 Tax=Streblomastix strix TaxID=222440 RepID=A0A5J4V9H6_9EUKA|nr:MAG: hypothetical protein EZS28_025393 [Streblomastix strix]